MKVMIFIGLIVFAVALATIIQQRFLQKISVNYIA
ncbi:sodium:proton antiporter, partial [Lactobacillus helveticus]|nr:sodium:proton antiporter [Lactobacillus helveticus]